MISSISGVTARHVSVSTNGRGSNSPLLVDDASSRHHDDVQQASALRKNDIKSAEPIYTILTADSLSDEEASTARTRPDAQHTPTGLHGGLHKVLDPIINRVRGPPRSADAITSDPNKPRFDFGLTDSEDSNAKSAEASAALPRSQSDEMISKGIHKELRSRKPRLATIAGSPLQKANFRRVRSESTNEGDWMNFLASISAMHPELEHALNDPSIKDTDVSQHADVFEPAVKKADNTSSFV